MAARRTTRRTTATPPVQRLDCDLDGLGRRVDAWCGRVTGFADAVTAYRTGVDRRKVLTADARRTEIRRRCAVALANGLVSDGRRVIVPVRFDERIVRRVTSEAVRQCSETLWAASRVRAVTLAISRTGGAPIVAPTLVTPTLELLMRTLVNEANAIKAAKALEADGRDRLRAALLDTAEATGWGGEQWRTTDGWAIGFTSNVRFNAKVAEALAPDHGIEVADITADVLVKGSQWYAVREVGAEVGGEGDPYSE